MSRLLSDWLWPAHEEWGANLFYLPIRVVAFVAPVGMTLWIGGPVILDYLKLFGLLFASACGTPGHM